MQNPQILSTPTPEPKSAPQSPPTRPRAGSAVDGKVRRALVFDACEVGVVLRAVLFVEIVLGVGAMYGADTVLDWLARLALLTGGALPATLAWLIAACSMKTLLQRLSTSGQFAAGVALGALAGLYACTMLALAGVVAQPPWLASSASGALLAAALVAALVLRARGRTPAATTARLTELQSRIRPHFLFNTLNSAIALVRNDPAQAESLLEDLSDLFRHALMEQGEAVTLAKKSRWRGAICTSNKCVLARACKCSGSSTRAPTGRACHRFCCSRWSKTPSNTVWNPAPKAASCACKPSGAAAGCW